MTAREVKMKCSRSLQEMMDECFGKPVPPKVEPQVAPNPTFSRSSFARKLRKAQFIIMAVEVTAADKKEKRESVRQLRSLQSCPLTHASDAVWLTLARHLNFAAHLLIG